MADNDLQKSIQEIRNIIARLKRIEAAARDERRKGEQFLAELEVEQAVTQIVVH